MHHGKQLPMPGRQDSRGPSHSGWMYSAASAVWLRTPAEPPGSRVLKGSESRESEPEERPVEKRLRENRRDDTRITVLEHVMVAVALLESKTTLCCVCLS